MVVYEATEMGLSHQCTGKVFNVSSVPRIVRRIKSRLGRMSPAERAERLESWHVGAARIDALVAISNARASGYISSKYFSHLDFRIDNRARELFTSLKKTANNSLPEELMRKARRRKSLRKLPQPMKEAARRVLPLSKINWSRSFTE
mmetsp:Transcript_22650/g.28020  ORF Transcript_22650/g.28020 Transcript_22650/m.28020 type:complete len:147 (+) Transcript_22650:316-756(+)